MKLVTAPATAQHAEALVGLFEATDCPCYCRWWHFRGDKNAWQDRCANAARVSKREMLAALENQSDEMQGAVAFDGDELVGWMKICPAPAVAKIYTQRLYRGLPCFEGDRSGVWTVGCFLIDERARGRGVAHALLAAGLELAEARGARAVEAFPRRSDTASGEELWTGPASVYERAGFEVVHDFGPYPVLRRQLGG